MPPKHKKAAQELKKCDLCTSAIKAVEDALQCSGPCGVYVHRYCAGVTLKHYKEIQDSGTPFLCLLCSQKAHIDKVESLQNEVDSLKQSLAQIQTTLSPTQTVNVQLASKQSPASQQASKSISSYASVCSHVVNNSSHQSLNLKNEQGPFNDAECKFNVIIYGLPECQKGTPKYKRTISDSNSASLAIQSICPEISQQSVRDCSRLGKYSQDHQRPRPVLVRLTRTCEVASILSNRRKLASTPDISIKPHMSFKEKQIESILLRERRALIDNGIDKKSIKLRGNAIYVNGIKHGTASESAFNNLSLHERESPASNIEQQEVHTPQANATNVSTNVNDSASTSPYNSQTIPSSIMQPLRSSNDISTAPPT